jgi:hypothetical protein
MIGIKEAVHGAITGGAEAFGRWRDRKRGQLPDTQRRERLIVMLTTGPHEWRTTVRLMRRIDADRETAVRLLTEIGAEHSSTTADVWRLPPGHPRKPRSQGPK